MKKIILWILTLCIVVSTCIFPVSASETNSVGVSVIYTEKKHITPDNAYYDHGDNTRSSAVHDLSDSIISIYRTLDAENSWTSSLCKTNTTRIYVPIEADQRVSFTVELLDSENDSINETTFTYDPIDERSPTVVFTNLTASKTYRVRITNNNQYSVVVFGAIRDSAWF